MPTYDYRCDLCHERFELWQSFSDETLVTCPTAGGPDACQAPGEGPVKKVFSQVGIAFKGDGFYKNDHGANAKGRSKESGSDKGSKSDSSGSGSEKSGSSGSGSEKSGSSGSGSEKSGSSGADKGSKSDSSGSGSEKSSSSGSSGSGSSSSRSGDTASAGRT